MDPKKIIETAIELTEEFLAQFGLDAELKIEFMAQEDADKGQYLYIQLNGDHLSELVGYHGKNLEATQVMLGLMLNRKIGHENGVRVLVDVNDYRERRKSSLESHALRAADQVRQSGQELELEPMKPYERRVVHMVLKQEEGIATHSVGEGRDRHIVIAKAA